MNNFYKDVITVLLECDKDIKCFECKNAEKCSIIFGNKKLCDIPKTELKHTIFDHERLLIEYGKDFK